MTAAPTPAHDVVMTMLRARFPAPPPRRVMPGLTPFQQEGLDRIRTIVARYRGALLADSVGLGKTMVARALILEESRAGGRVLVTAPAQLERHWRRHLNGVRHWDWMSHTLLSRRARSIEPRWTLVVADEAHAFRNACTRRYDALSRICREARALLLSATPVNNSIYDFYHLVRLFADDRAFTRDGVPDLKAAADAAAYGAGVELRRVVECIVVRRTRAVLQHLPADGDAPTHLRFPRSGPVEPLGYDLEATYPGLLTRLATALAGLRFPAHGEIEHAGMQQMLRLNLLKRLESSSTALRTSLARHAAALRLFLDAAAAGREFLVARDADLLRAFLAVGQTALRDVALPPWPLERERRAAIRIAREDLERIDGLLAALDRETPDPKLERLRSLLLTELASEHVLLFSEYRETATMLWRALLPLGGVALLHGEQARLGAAPSTRRAVIERFAPIANGARLPPPHQQVRLLIATDVLAEGMNLQDARIVVAYDLPWNPVRLAQRIGRIDRLGSPHDTIRALAFRPDRGLDELLGLMHRIREKLRAARVVGSDTPRLGKSRSPATSGDRSHRRLVSLTDLDELELLRARLRSSDPKDDRRVGAAAGRDRRPGHSADHHLGAVSAPVQRLTAVWCLARGSSCWLALVQDGRPVQVGTRQLCRLLLDALDSREPALSTEPYGTWEKDSLRAARRAIGRIGRRRRPAPVRATASRDRFQGSLVFPVDRSAAVTAVELRRWLAARPGGASVDELMAADGWLEQLRRDASRPRSAGHRMLRDRDLRVVAGLLLIPAGTG